MRAPRQRRGENGTLVIKFFLHLSKEEQRKRFLAHLDEVDTADELHRKQLAK
jgi:hypothetical protein